MQDNNNRAKAVLKELLDEIDSFAEIPQQLSAATLSRARQVIRGGSPDYLRETKQKPNEN